MIKINKIRFSYPTKEEAIFNDFSIDFSKGKIYGLFGKNGTGKSTLLYLISGLLHPQKGEITYNNKAVKKREADCLNKLFLVPEEFELPPISLKSYVKMMAPFYPNFSWENLKQNLDNFKMESDINMKTLSMGKKKKLFISFALATNTPLLLLDEPSNGLDIPSKSQFRKVLASQMNEERTIIISTHQVKDIDTLLDHVTIIDEGKTILNNSIEELTEKLSFEQRGMNEPIDDVLYYAPSIEGYSVLVPNHEKRETNLNIELLFNAALANSTEIKAMLTDKTK